MFGERVEMGIKLGKIQDVGTDKNQVGGAKKSFGGYQKKKEGDSSALYERRGKEKRQEFNRQVAAVTIPTSIPKQDVAPRQHQPRPVKKFDPLPMSYADVFAHLQSLNMIELRSLKVDPDNLPKYFNANARCLYHSNAPGHSIENCYAFKYKVQNLLDTEAINFGPPPTPNVIQHPLPPHGGNAVNAICEEGSFNLITNVDALTI